MCCDTWRYFIRSNHLYEEVFPPKSRLENDFRFIGVWNSVGITSRICISVQRTFRIEIRAVRGNGISVIGTVETHPY